MRSCLRNGGLDDMGAVLKLVLAIMITSTLILLLGGAMYSGSTDANKTQFVAYRGDNSSLSNMSVINGTNTNDSTSNMQRVSQGMLQKIVDSQKNLNSNDPAAQILAAFGLAAALSIDLIFLFVAVPLDGVNFVGGILFNLASLDAPWSMFGVLGALIIGIFIVYLAFKIAAMVLKWDT